MKYLDNEHNWNRKVRNKFGYDAYEYGSDEIREYLEKNEFYFSRILLPKIIICLLKHLQLKILKFHL